MNNYTQQIINIIKNYNELKELIIILKKNHCFSFVLHTHHNQKKILGIGISMNTKSVHYIPFLQNHYYTTDTSNNLKKHPFITFLKEIFENPKIKKISHNLKVVIKILKIYHINLSQNIFDIMLASYAFDNTLNNYNCINIIKIHWIKTENTSLITKINNLNTDGETKITLKNTYILFEIYLSMTKKIQSNIKIQHILEKIDFRLIQILSTIENNGVMINNEELIKINNIFIAKINYLKKNIYRISGKIFNLSSNIELFDILNPTIVFLKKINTNILSELSKDYLLPKLILKYRNLYKLKVTYLDKIFSAVDKKTYKIHCSYFQTNTITSRLSSGNPNLQNIPIHNKEGKYIRKIFVTSNKWILVSADYSQFELRLITHFSNDSQLIKIFLNNQDVHAITASEIFNIPIKNITDIQRNQAKIINFSLIYGMSSFGLSKKFKIDISEAKIYILHYFNKYNQLLPFFNKVKKDVLKTGYVTTLHGRKLYIPNIPSKIISKNQSLQRRAVNALIQGTTADIIKYAMIEINQIIQKKFKFDARMIIQIHDELIFEVKHDKLIKFKKLMINSMENIIQLKIPLTINVSVGNNWLELNKCHTY